MGRAWFCSGMILAALGANTVTTAEDKPAGFVEVDFTRVERKIVKEPVYVAKPQYAMFILDDAGKTRMWAVLDKSKKDLDFYDVMYFDLNSNGDLTEAGERFVGQYDEKKRSATGMSLIIRVGDVRVPGSEQTHKNFIVCTVPKKDREGIWFQMDWNGETDISGGHSNGIHNTRWSGSPDMAPILRPTVNGKLSFCLWLCEHLVLPLDDEEEINLMLGNAGSGADTLCALPEDFLDLEKDELWATVIAKDAEGKEVTLRQRIKEHC